MRTNYHKFLLLCLASLVSATGSGMTAFALGVYTYQQTGLSSLTGLLMLLGFLPSLLLTPLAGILADCYDRRLLMMLGDGCSMIGLLVILFSLTLPHQREVILGLGLGVVISAIFSSLVEPAFRATVSDLLEKEDYSKASGMVQLVASSRYLLSPVLAGLLLSMAGIQTIIWIDLMTVLLTLPITYLVRREMKNPGKVSSRFSIKNDIKHGFHLIYEKKGIWFLVLFGILISFYLGTIETLMTPMILAFSSERFLGTATTISASGMLVGGLILGSFQIKKGFTRILSFSLMTVALAMIGFAARESKLSLCLFGFILFAALPFANMAIDYLIRTNISAENQGKAWGLIGIISQIGYILAYGGIGLVNDYISQPLLNPHGLLVDNLGKIIGSGQGRGAALLIIIAGFLLFVTALSLFKNTDIKLLEDDHVLETA